MFSETVLALAQAQMLITSLLHFLFIPLSLGLALLVAGLESLYLYTGQKPYLQAAQFWARLFAINFSLALATRLLLLIQFGSNQSFFARYVGDIFGLPFAIEAITSFFLASILFGPFWFGWARLSKSQHWLISCFLVLILNLSALWIISAYAWLENPQGGVFNPQSLRIELDDLSALLNNPMATSKILHGLGICYTTAAATVLAISGWLLSKNPKDSTAGISFKLAAPLGLLALVLVLWPDHASNTRLSQAVHQAALNGEDTRQFLKPIENRIQQGVAAHQALQALRDDEKNPQLQANFAQLKADFGYGLLLKPFTSHIEKATPQQISQAALSALPGNSSVFFWAKQLLFILNLSLAIWFGLACISHYQSALRTGLSQFSLILLPLAWLTAIGAGFLNQASQQPWAVAETLPQFFSYSTLSSKELLISLTSSLLATTGLLMIAGLLMAFIIFNHARSTVR